MTARIVDMSKPAPGLATQPADTANSPSLATTLDPLDQALLNLLQANARLSTAELARQTGAARTTVLARLARLERQGVIAGYGVRLGRSVAPPLIQAQVNVAVAPRSGPLIVRAMQRMLEVRQILAVSGVHDLSVRLACASPEELDQVIDRIGTLEGVVRTETSVILGVKFDRDATT